MGHAVLGNTRLDAVLAQAPHTSNRVPQYHVPHNTQAPATQATTQPMVVISVLSSSIIMSKTLRLFKAERTKWIKIHQTLQTFDFLRLLIETSDFVTMIDSREKRKLLVVS